MLHLAWVLAGPVVAHPNMRSPRVGSVPRLAALGLLHGCLCSLAPDPSAHSVLLPGTRTKSPGHAVDVHSRVESPILVRTIRAIRHLRAVFEYGALVFRCPPASRTCLNCGVNP
jgi:hypothetical protein